MNSRSAILGAVLAFVALLAYLTVRVAIENGFDILVGVSLVVLALLGFGVLGALTAKDE